MENYIFSSLTRISDLATKPFQVLKLNKKQWQNGDYVAVEVVSTGGGFEIELASGRMILPFCQDVIIGALGVRHATLEATGSWRSVNPKHKMHMLTGAGIVGKLTSISSYLSELIGVKYLGHIQRDDDRVNMADFAMQVAPASYHKPTILIVGTSMSAGKTTSAKIIIRLLKRMGLQVVGAKLTGAGRYKDILSMRDAGASDIFDFVDVGLPSSICGRQDFLQRLEHLLSAIERTITDVAVIEVGASPLEPYNGDVAYEQIRHQVRFTVLCASDPYAALGVMEAFRIKPDLVTGIATNTWGGVELIKNLCKVPALNIINAKNWSLLQTKLQDKFGTS
ncbi:MAG: hypothetical protein OEQ53_16110 [Saprospiraceae bacterium]|nr:hypothetical protein [Saprospiraceae bacterium]